MTTNRSLHSCSFLACMGCSAALARTAIDRVWRTSAPLIASLCLVACTALPPARMALPAELEAATPLPFKSLGGGRSGRFTQDAQEITFRRLGDGLSVFDRLRLDRVSVEFERAGAKGRCDGRAAAFTVGIVDTPAQPLAQPAGYRLMIQGRDVAALDLAGGTPVLRRAAGLDEGTRAALTQVALALGLLFDPALTLD